MCRPVEPHKNIQVYAIGIILIDFFYTSQLPAEFFNSPRSRSPTRYGLINAFTGYSPSISPPTARMHFSVSSSGKV